jgi:hypothetical protein
VALSNIVGVEVESILPATVLVELYPKPTATPTPTGTLVTGTPATPTATRTPTPRPTLRP